MKLRNKKFLSLLVCLILFCSAWTNSVQAIESKNPKETQGRQLLSEKTIEVGTNKKAVKSELPKREKDALKKLLKSKSPKLVARNTLKSSANFSNIDTGIGENSVSIRYSLYANNKTRTVTDEIEIVKINGIPPLTITAGQMLLNSNLNNPIMANWYHHDIFDNLRSTWTGLEIHVGQKISETFPAETKWWSIAGSAGATYANETIDEIAWELPYSLINRTGNVFPDYQDPWSKQKASDYLETNWTKVADPVPYDGQKDRARVIANYINTYGNPNYEWSAAYTPNYYEMHHRRPRSLGGDNWVGNLIPVPYQDHKAITSWFAGY